jgi:hypothetical protein
VGRHLDAPQFVHRIARQPIPLEAPGEKSMQTFLPLAGSNRCDLPAIAEGSQLIAV